MNDLYNTTLLSSRVPGAPRVRIESSVLEMATGQRCLHAVMVITTDDNGISSTLTMPLDHCTMRALARILNEHAARIAVELLPLLSHQRIDPEALALVKDPA